MSVSDRTGSGVDAVVLGAAAMDMLAWVERLPEKDGIVRADRMEMQPGGSGANVAVALARLGVKTRFLANLSGDANGQVLIRNFMDEGVDISACRFVEDKPTALCFITIDRAGDRSMVALGGAGSLETADVLDLEALTNARLIYITDATAPIIDIVADVALKQGIFLVYSPGGLTASRGLSYVADLLTKPDLWLLSRSEARDLLVGSPPEVASTALYSQGARRAVVTLGEKGAAYAGPEGAFTVPAFPAARVLDTTGAGDAFAAGMAAGILGGKPMAECLRYASAAASLKVGYAGARGGLPSAAELESFLAGSTR